MIFHIDMGVPNGIHSKVAKRIYPLGRIPTHHRKEIGTSALGNNLGGLYLCRYHEHNSI